jgi:hypothetical protein
VSTFTKLYLTNVAAPYTPATLRGTWNDTAGVITKALEPDKTAGGVRTTVARAEANASNPYDVLLYRGVSGPLAAQTISGNLNCIIGVTESNASADDNWHIHVYVTQGDSDTPRGTLLSDYTESAGTNEWGTNAATAGKALNAAQSLSSLAISDGDRLIVEIGYRARNAVTTSFIGTLYCGTISAIDSGVMADLATSGDPTAGAGFLTFSNAITELGTINARATQSRALAIGDDSGMTARVQFSRALAIGDESSMTASVQFSQLLVIADPISSATALPFYPVPSGQGPTNLPF